MRTTRDRICYAVSFEIIDLALVTQLGVWAFGRPVHAVRLVRGSTQKTGPIRVLHAVPFEGGLLIVLLPVIAWYLGIGLWQDFLMDVSSALFYLGYAFVFN
jgi:uncharacterized membrane protein